MSNTLKSWVSDVARDWFLSAAIKRTHLTGVEIVWDVVKYDGVSNFSYEYFDIEDKQKIGFLEFVIMYVQVCLVSF